ncbi:UNVERIFIED_CONTAM: hypothetical protein ABID98_005287 [Brevibacillus sp. OAP136]
MLTCRLLLHSFLNLRDGTIIMNHRGSGTTIITIRIIRTIHIIHQATIRIIPIPPIRHIHTHIRIMAISRWGLRSTKRTAAIIFEKLEKSLFLGTNRKEAFLCCITDWSVYGRNHAFHLGSLFPGVAAVEMVASGHDWTAH